MKSLLLALPVFDFLTASCDENSWEHQLAAPELEATGERMPFAAFFHAMKANGTDSVRIAGAKGLGALKKP